MSNFLADYGWAGGPLPQGGQLGRIVRVDRGECDVVTADGPLRVVSDSHRAQSETAPATGDWVLVVADSGIGPVIKRVLPRRNTLSRRDPAEEIVEQVLVANVDFVLIVHGLDRPLPAGRLERYLILAWDSGAEVAMVLTKADCDAKAITDVVEVVRAIAPDLDILMVDLAGSNEGVGAVEALLRPGSTVALLGESGSGKSTLVNALIGKEVQATGQVRSRDRKGRHTTVSRELLLRPSGGLLVDTPGLRSIGLWDAEEALDRVFGDLEELSGQCRFVDCAHETEPDCAVRGQLLDGQEGPRRLERYRALRKELVDQRERATGRKRSKVRRRR